MEEEELLEFVCSVCGRKTKRDSYTFYASMVAPDETRKCPECGHMPDTRFYYCSPECFEKGVKRHGIHRPYYVFWGWHKVPEWWPYKELAKREVKVIKRRKPTFHEDFPRLAKELGFRVYWQGFPDCLIEKEGKYVAVEVKEYLGLDFRQQLMHQALRRAGLKVIVVTPDIDVDKAFRKP